MTDPCERLHAYVDDELTPEERADLESHLTTCETCGKELPQLLALMSALDAAVARAEPRAAAPHLTLVSGTGDPGRPPRSRLAPPRLGGRRRALWFGAAATALVAAAGLLFVLRAPHTGDAPVVASLDRELAPTRSLMPRLSYRGADRYRPLDGMRGTRSIEAISIESMGRLEQAKDWHGVAVASLLAGERERAARFFEKAPSTPQIDSDRAALELMDGSDAALARALDDVDRALAAAPNHPGALWNRALVLAALNLPLAAARDFDRVVALGEPGWSDEARKYATAHRSAVEQRRTRWKQAVDARRRLLEDGTPVPAALTAVTGYMTMLLYDAVRSAPSSERVRALIPLAQQLDIAYGSDRLTSYVRQIASSDFRVRKPLADTYREMMLKGSLPDVAVDAVLKRLEQAGIDDIWMGMMIWTGRVSAHVEDYRRRAQASGDPWFIVIAEHETAKAEIAHGEAVAAERRIREALTTARRERMAYRELILQGQLGALHNSLRNLSQVASDRQIEYREATSAGEWDREMNALSLLTAINLNRYANAMARGSLTEMIERLEGPAATSPGAQQDKYDCARRQYAHDSLASIAIFSLDPDRARAELAASPTCNDKLTAPYGALQLNVLKALNRATLYRFDHRDEDARLARDSLAALRQDPELTARESAFLSYIDGLLVVDENRSAGRRFLRAAIDQAGSRTDDLNLKARAYSFALLAVDAGKTAEFADVIAVLAEALAVPTPDRCALAIAVHDNRSVVAFSDAQGQTGGDYVAARQTVEFDVSTLVPPPIVERLRACDHVRVLSRAPVLGTGRLLPSDLAWSYLLGVTSRSAITAGQHRLVVANPETPAELSLPALGQYPDDPDSADVLLLRGGDATPTRVMQAMRDASVIEFHTHGFIGNDVSEASYLVLSPESDRRYALTASDVTKVKLEASPLVILGACHAATSSRSLEGGMGLAEAFLRSGARAVVASPDAVPDLAAQAVFVTIRKRVVAGASPAIAVRDERVRRLTMSPNDTWVSGIVVFE